VVVAASAAESSVLPGEVALLVALLFLGGLLAAAGPCFLGQPLRVALLVLVALVALLALLFAPLPVLLLLAVLVLLAALLLLTLWLLLVLLALLPLMTGELSLRVALLGLGGVLSADTRSLLSAELLASLLLAVLLL